MVTFVVTFEYNAVLIGGGEGVTHGLLELLHFFGGVVGQVHGRRVVGHGTDEHMAGHQLALGSGNVCELADARHQMLFHLITAETEPARPILCVCVTFSFCVEVFVLKNEPCRAEIHTAVAHM